MSKRKPKGDQEKPKEEPRLLEGVPLWLERYVVKKFGEQSKTFDYKSVTRLERNLYQRKELLNGHVVYHADSKYITLQPRTVIKVGNTIYFREENKDERTPSE